MAFIRKFEQAGKIDYNQLQAKTEKAKERIAEEKKKVITKYDSDKAKLESDYKAKTDKSNRFVWEGVGTFDKSAILQEAARKMNDYADRVGMSKKRREMFREKLGLMTTGITNGTVTKRTGKGYVNTANINSTGKYKNNFLGRVKVDENTGVNDASAFISEIMNGMTPLENIDSIHKNEYETNLSNLDKERESNISNLDDKESQLDTSVEQIGETITEEEKSKIEEDKLKEEERIKNLNYKVHAPNVFSGKGAYVDFDGNTYSFDDEDFESKLNEAGGKYEKFKNLGTTLANEMKLSSDAMITNASRLNPNDFYFGDLVTGDYANSNYVFDATSFAPNLKKQGYQLVLQTEDPRKRNSATDRWTLVPNRYDAEGNLSRGVVGESFRVTPKESTDGWYFTNDDGSKTYFGGTYNYDGSLNFTNRLDATKYSPELIEAIKSDVYGYNTSSAFNKLSNAVSEYSTLNKYPSFNPGAALYNYFGKKGENTNNSEFRYNVKNNVPELYFKFGDDDNKLRYVYTGAQSFNEIDNRRNGLIPKAQMGIKITNNSQPYSYNQPTNEEAELSKEVNDSNYLRQGITTGQAFFGDEELEDRGGGIKATDRVRFASAVADLVSVGLGFVPGANIASAGVGATASLADFGADIADGEGWLKSAGGLALNLGLDAVSLIPGLKSLKGIKQMKKITAIGTSVLLNATQFLNPDIRDSYLETLNKMKRGNFNELTTGDFQNLNAIGRIALMGKNAFGKKARGGVRKNSDMTSIETKIDGSGKTVNVPTAKLKAANGDKEKIHSLISKETGAPVDQIETTWGKKWGFIPYTARKEIKTSKGKKTYDPTYNRIYSNLDKGYQGIGSDVWFTNKLYGDSGVKGFITKQAGGKSHEAFINATDKHNAKVENRFNKRINKKATDNAKTYNLESKTSNKQLKDLANTPSEKNIQDVTYGMIPEQKAKYSTPRMNEVDGINIPIGEKSRPLRFQTVSPTELSKQAALSDNIQKKKFDDVAKRPTTKPKRKNSKPKDDTKPKNDKVKTKNNVKDNKTKISKNNEQLSLQFKEAKSKAKKLQMGGIIENYNNTVRNKNPLVNKYYSTSGKYSFDSNKSNYSDYLNPNKPNYYKFNKNTIEPKHPELLKGKMEMRGLKEVSSKELGKPSTYVKSSLAVDGNPQKSKNNFNFRKEDVLEIGRTLAGLKTNNRLAKEYRKGVKPLIMNAPESSNIPIVGDFQGKQQAAIAGNSLLNRVSKPLTSDASLHKAGQLEAMQGVNSYNAEASARDAQMFNQSRLQNAEINNRDAAIRADIANKNASSMLQAKSALSQIEAGRIANNFTNVINPIASNIENRYRKNSDFERQLKLQDAESSVKMAYQSQYQSIADALTRETDLSKKQQLYDRQTELAKNYLNDIKTSRNDLTGYNYLFNKSKKYARGGRLTAQEQLVVDQAKDFNKRLNQNQKEFNKNLQFTMKQSNSMINSLSAFTKELIKGAMVYK